MRAGSLLKRFLPTTTGARATPAYCLSCSVPGRSRLTYLPQDQVASVCQQCAADRAYQQALCAWRQENREMERLWQQPRQAQWP